MVALVDSGHNWKEIASVEQVKVSRFLSLADTRLVEIR